MLALGGAFEADRRAEGPAGARRWPSGPAASSPGEQVVVGVNRFTETAPSPLGGDGRDPHASTRRSRPRLVADVERVAGRPRRRPRCRRALDELRRAAERRRRTSCRPPIALAQAGGTTGEWAGALREVFGEYRAPTGVGGRRRAAGRTSWPPSPTRVKGAARRPAPAPRGQARPRRPLQRRRADRRGRPRRRHGGRLLGHPPHARADRGLGARRGPRRDRPVDPVGQPPRARARGASTGCAAEGVDAPVVVGGIIPEEDRAALLAAGVAAVYTPKDFELGRIMDEIAGLTEERRAAV